MRFEGDFAIFSSGLRRYAYGSIFGITKVDNEIVITYGHDGQFDPDSFSDPDLYEIGELEYEKYRRLSPGERRELAEYNIKLWQEYGNVE